MMRAMVLAGALLAAAQVDAAAQPMPRGRQALDVPASRPATDATGGMVYLRGLDTLNGTARDIDMAVGETFRFGHLEITADACRMSGDGPGADSYALLRIRDDREDAPRFAGWMLSSSPALSALDHPRYDVWVLSCSSR